MNSIIETVSGKMIDAQCPNPDDLSINDIAWALSRISRFCGHTITKIPYNVAQHSVFVAQMISRDREAGMSCPDFDITKECVLFGLLHDASEFLIGDIPSPVKHIPEMHPIIERIEQNILHTIFKKFVGRIPTVSELKVVKYYDKKAQFIEAHNFMVSRGNGWINREMYNISLLELQEFPTPTTAVDSYKAFISYYESFK